MLPVRDRAGNVLVEFRFVTEGERWPGVEGLPMPAALVVVGLADTVLMIFDSWRRQWELPGGTREPGETAREAALRELGEETGLAVPDVAFAGLAEFALVRPRRRELLAVYHVRLDAMPRLTANEEALDFRWWSPAAPVSAGMSPLDAEIARLVTRSLAG